jgi:succinate dehydrogenase / fumarate reductase flavoprotein subunit
MRTDYTERNDEKYLKTTKGSLDKNGDPVIEYEEVNVTYLKPRLRNYSKKK